ncbi:MAG: PIG-L family deacetylase, partial [Terriglobales bacterium]
MAQEVYKAAGDPKLFPGQIKAGLRPWTPLKVYARVPTRAISAKGIYDYATGDYSPARFFDYVHGAWIQGLPSTQVEIPEGTYAPELGASYLQIARQGLGEQRSQHGGPTLPDPGPSNTPYHLYASRVPTPGAGGGQETSMFEGIDTSLEGIAALAPAADRARLRPPLARISRLVDQATAQFVGAHPESIAPLLAQGLSATEALIARVNASPLPAAAKDDINYELNIKRAQFNDALTEALGLTVVARVVPAVNPRQSFGPRPTFTVAIPGQHFKVDVHVSNAGNTPVALSQLSLKSRDGENWAITPEKTAVGSLPPSQAADAVFEVAVPADAGYTRPYYSRPSIEQPYYDIDQQKYLNRPNMPYPVAAWAQFS